MCIDESIPQYQHFRKITCILSPLVKVKFSAYRFLTPTQPYRERVNSISLSLPMRIYEKISWKRTECSSIFERDLLVWRITLVFKSKPIFSSSGLQKSEVGAGESLRSSTFERFTQTSRQALLISEEELETIKREFWECSPKFHLLIQQYRSQPMSWYWRNAMTIKKWVKAFVWPVQTIWSLAHCGNLSIHYSETNGGKRWTLDPVNNSSGCGEWQMELFI